MTRYAALPDPEVGVWLRLYIYGLHGFLIEVLFTAVWDFVVHRDWALVGEYRCMEFSVCSLQWCIRPLCLMDLSIIENGTSSM